MQNYIKFGIFRSGTKFDFGRIFPKICENFRRRGAAEGRKRGEKRVFRGSWSIKMHFYFTGYQQVD
jgi:hypothetical protein